MNVFKPEVFQGKLSLNHYFEGWYFKHVSKELEHVYSFIPGISLNVENPHAFIQIINGITGNSQYIEYPLSQFKYDKGKFRVQIGDSVFTADDILLNINSPLIKVSGRLGYSGSVKYPSSVFSPGIMGWYSFVPYMECKHAVVSVLHRIDGSLLIDDVQLDFSGGKGYIEKDWGKSFPESWIWFQSNNFTNSDACIMVSIAKIPWLGSFFTGFLGFLYYNGVFYPFTTYHKSEISALNFENEILTLGFKSKKYQLNIKAILKNTGILLAPKLGEMSRRIKESVDSELYVELLDLKGNLIYQDTASRTGLEVIEGIFEIVKIKTKK
jgi:tocopherol cyclase